MRKQGYLADWGTVRWCQGPNNNDGCYDAETIALHELGHVHGIDHNPSTESGGNWTQAIMHQNMRAKPVTGWSLHDYRPCDVARLQMRYEAKTPTTPYATCFLLDTTMTLSAPIGPHDPGASVVFNAWFKIASGETATLAGDEIDGRVVTLQRRAIGASGWSNIATMTSLGSGSGQYRVTRVVSASYEYRATYSYDSSEGLEGASSAVVEVDVNCEGFALAPCA